MISLIYYNCTVCKILLYSVTQTKFGETKRGRGEVVSEDQNSKT